MILQNSHQNHPKTPAILPPPNLPPDSKEWNNSSHERRKEEPGNNAWHFQPADSPQVKRKLGRKKNADFRCFSKHLSK